jgi:DNA-binding NarL/FixJ family response regulator
LRFFNRPVIIFAARCLFTVQQPPGVFRNSAKPDHAYKKGFGDEAGLPPFSLLPTNTSLLITPRESQVLQLLASGLSNKEIAAALCLSDKTVATHMKSIFEKLGVHNRVLAVRAGQDLGLLTLTSNIPSEQERERERER